MFQKASFNDGQAFHVYTVAMDKKEIISQSFLNVTAQYLTEDCPIPDILVIPGGNTINQVSNEKLISWISRVNQQTDYVLSVCNGVRLLTKTGALNGLTATSHFGAIDNLQRSFRKSPW